MRESLEVGFCVLGEGDRVIDEVLSKYVSTKSLPQDLPRTSVGVARDIGKSSRRGPVRDINEAFF